MLLFFLPDWWKTKGTPKKAPPKNRNKGGTNAGEVERTPRYPTPWALSRCRALVPAEPGVGVGRPGLPLRRARGLGLATAALAPFFQKEQMGAYPLESSRKLIPQSFSQGVW